MSEGITTCDTCGEPIMEIKHGWVEWLIDTGYYDAGKGRPGRAHGLRVCHHLIASPRHVDGRRDVGCYLYDEARGRRDHHLSVIVNRHLLDEYDFDAASTRYWHERIAPLQRIP